MNNLFELAFVILILYLLYKFIYNIVVPVSKATATVREGMRRMQEEQQRTQQAYQQQPARNTAASTPRHDSTTTDGEYIDYEEVK